MLLETLAMDPMKTTLVWVPVPMEGMLDLVVSIPSTNQPMGMQGTLEIHQHLVALSMETQLGDLDLPSLMEPAHLVMGLEIQLQMLQQRAQQVTWGID
jgi:hypothetical protein